MRLAVTVILRNYKRLTPSDLVEAGEHAYHKAGRYRDGVSGLLQHHLVPPAYKRILQSLIWKMLMNSATPGATDASNNFLLYPEL
jgi:hypothetical protein